MILEVEEEAVPVKEVAVVAVKEVVAAEEAAEGVEEVAEAEVAEEEIPHLHPHHHLHRVQVLHAEDDEGKEAAS